MFCRLETLKKKSSSTWTLERGQLSGEGSTSPLFLLWHLKCYYSYSSSHLPWASTPPVPLDPQITTVLKATLTKIHILSDWAQSDSSWAQNQPQRLCLQPQLTSVTRNKARWPLRTFWTHTAVFIVQRFVLMVNNLLRYKYTLKFLFQSWSHHRLTLFV